MLLRYNMENFPIPVYYLMVGRIKVLKSKSSLKKNNHSTIDLHENRVILVVNAKYYNIQFSVIRFTWKR